MTTYVSTDTDTLTHWKIAVILPDNTYDLLDPDATEDPAEVETYVDCACIFDGDTDYPENSTPAVVGTGTDGSSGPPDNINYYTIDIQFYVRDYDLVSCYSGDVCCSGAQSLELFDDWADLVEYSAEG